MAGIICAVRGGPGSHRTRQAGLERAAAAREPLYVLVTVAASGYRRLHGGEQRAIRAELAWRELALLRATAERAGRPDVPFNIQVRIGDMGEAIRELAAETGAGRVLIGQPRRAADAVLGGAALADLVADLERAGCKVEVVSAANGPA